MNSLKRANEFVRLNKHPKKKERPQIHVAPEIGWMNDPNGFSVYQGDIHLFYQYHPYSDQWGPMYWGHVKSKDMITWENLPVALAPDSGADEAGCFSGTAVAYDDQHVLMYTAVSGDLKEPETLFQNQSIAIGDGEKYKKVFADPVITGEMLPEGCSRQDFRDPKIWKEGDSFLAIVANLDSDERGQILLFESKDLIDWKYVKILAKNDGRYGRMWECPDFFSIEGISFLIVSPQDMPARGYEFHPGNNAVYFPGDWNKEEWEFTYDEATSLDYGLDFYAPQTTQLEDGRRVLIAWMQSWDGNIKPAKQDWNGMMTIPRELLVINGRLIQQPIRELEKYHTNHQERLGHTIQGRVSVDSISGRCMDLTLDLLEGDFESLKISFACDEVHHTDFIFHKSNGIIEYDRTFSGVVRDVGNSRKMKVNPRDGGVKLRFILDYYSIELFVNDGEQCFSAAYYTPLEADAIWFDCDGEVKMDIKKDDFFIDR